MRNEGKVFGGCWLSLDRLIKVTIKPQILLADVFMNIINISFGKH